MPYFPILSEKKPDGDVFRTQSGGASVSPAYRKPARVCRAALALMLAMLLTAGGFLFTCAKDAPSSTATASSFEELLKIGEQDKHEHAEPDEAPDTPNISGPKSYTGDSGTVFTVTPGYQQVRYVYTPLAAQRSKNAPCIPPFTLPNGDMVFDSQEEATDGGLYTIYTFAYTSGEVIEAAVEQYTSDLTSYDLEIVMPYTKTKDIQTKFEGDLRIYEAGLRYTGSGNITRNLFKATGGEGLFDVHVVLIYYRWKYTMHLYYPDEMLVADAGSDGSFGAINRLSEYTFDPSGTAYDRDRYAFKYDDEGKSRYVGVWLHSGRYAAGDEFSPAELMTGSTTAFNYLEYDVRGLKKADDLYLSVRGISYAEDLIDGLVFRIVEMTDYYQTAYIRFMYHDKEDGIYEVEGFGCTPVTINEDSVWYCDCGAVNTLLFCVECGAKKPASAEPWVCGCGQQNYGNFCGLCGNPRPVALKCEKCGYELDLSTAPKFCPQCGSPTNVK